VIYIYIVVTLLSEIGDVYSCDTVVEMGDICSYDIVVANGRHIKL